MKRLIIIAFLGAVAFGQTGRFDTPGTTTTATIGGVPGVVVVVPNASVRICTYSLTPSVPCSPLATTYTDATGATACPSTAQVVLAGTNTCTSNSDANGNYGFWGLAGATFICQISGGGVTTTNVVCSTSGAASAVTPGGNNTFTGINTFTGVSAFTSPGVFTDTQLNQPSTFDTNSFNFTTEFQLAEGSHGTTEAISGGVAVPIGATVIQAEGIGGYANNSSTATISYGGYFQSRCVLNNTHCGGINPVVFDTAGLTSGVVMYNDDALLTPRNATSAYQFLAGKAMGLNATQAGSFGAAFYSYTQNPGSSQWVSSFRSVDGGATIGVLIGSLAANTGSTTSDSQPLQFTSWNAGVANNNSMHMDNNGNLLETGFPVVSMTAATIGGNTAGATLNSGTGLYQSKKNIAGCTTAASLGGVCVTPINFNWTAAFADTNYSVNCFPSGAPTNLPSTPYVSSKTASGINVNYFAITAAAASWATIDCIAVHD
jgi:hypothetical protein